jgi:ribonuclease P protein subunit POP4
MITAENLVRHELIGLRVRVSDSSGREFSGTVIDESRNTLTIEQEGKERQFIKEQCVFTFSLPGSGQRVRVSGDVIVARPEDRIKKKLKKW